MRSITRYILRQLVMVTVLVTLGLTMVVWLSQSLRFMDYIVNRGLPASDFLMFIAFLLPGFLGAVLPIAAFCAVLFVYNKLSGESELVVLRAAGLSQWQLARPALVLALAVTLIVYSVSLYLLPASYQAFKDLQFKIRHDYATVLLQEGVFNRISEELTVYVRERTQEGELRGILVHDTRESEKPVTMMATSGALVKTGSGPRVVLLDGNRQVVDPETGRLSMLYFDRYTVDIGQLRESLETRWREPRERYLGNLLYPGPGPNDQRYAKELIAEGHRRIVFPAFTFAYVAIGLAALLTGEFSRRGQFKRIFAAVAAVGVLQALQLTITDIASRDLSAVPGLYVSLAAGVIVPATMLTWRRRRGGETPPLAPARMEPAQ